MVQVEEGELHVEDLAVHEVEGGKARVVAEDGRD